MSNKTLSTLYLLYSAVSIVFISSIIFLTPRSTQSVTIFEQQILGSIFFLGCLFGISCCIWPNWSKKMLYVSLDKKPLNSNVLVKNSFVGHHPNCEMFNHHRMQICNTKICVGCLGLGIGLCSCIVLIVLYFLYNSMVLYVLDQMLVVLSFMLICLVFVEGILKNRNRLIHVIVNMFFIPCLFLVTIHVFHHTSDIFFGFITMVCCWLWVQTRITVSKKYHSYLCTTCVKTCKKY